MRRRRLSIAVAAAVASLGLVATGAASAAATSSTRPTLAQLAAYLTSSAAATKVPDLSKTVPPLATLNNETDGAPPGISTKCYTQTASSVPKDAATLCAWGDKSSKHVLYLFGDSQASMWLNTFLPVAQALHWKIVETAHTGCPPWPDQSAYEENGTNDVQCVHFDASELALARSLHPQVVVADGDGFHVGTGVWATVAQIERGERDLVKDVAPAHVVFLSPIPMFQTGHLSYTPSACLVSVSNLKKCDFAPSKLVEPHQFTASHAAATATHESFISVTRLFCTSTSCPAILSDHGERLVFLDSEHDNRFYMAWIAVAFEQLLKPDL